MTRSDLETARMQELLATRATQGLDETEAAELARLGEDDAGFEEAAAMIDLVTLPRETLSPALADKIFAAATRSASATAPAVPAVPKFTGAALAVVTPVPKSTSRPRVPRLVWAGWGVAALAAVAALWLWRSRPQPATEDRPAAALQDELAAADDVVRFSAEGPGATGTVLWSGRRQRGVLRLSGLASNDPRTQRYQIWIFDRARDERYPVDGGLFDVTERELTVEIRPRVQIEAATGFWVTREVPAGAVVSDRTHVMVRTK